MKICKRLRAPYPFRTRNRTGQRWLFNLSSKTFWIFRSLIIIFICHQTPVRAQQFSKCSINFWWFIVIICYATWPMQYVHYMYNCNCDSVGMQTARSTLLHIAHTCFDLDFIFNLLRRIQRKAKQTTNTFSEIVYPIATLSSMNCDDFIFRFWFSHFPNSNAILHTTAISHSGERWTICDLYVECWTFNRWTYRLLFAITRSSENFSI